MGNNKKEKKEIKKNRKLLKNMSDRYGLSGALLFYAMKFGIIFGNDKPNQP